MKHLHPIAFMCFLLIFIAQPAVAEDPARQFINGTEAYNAGDYQTAIELFTRIADGGVRNTKLYYNLGNAHLKQDDLGRAILWYERARRLKPGDPDLTFNYEYALSLTQDEKTETTSPLSRILFFWKYAYSKQSIQWAALVVNALFWIVLIAYVASGKRLFKRLGAPLLFLTLLLTATAAYNYYETARIRHGVILPEQVSVRSGFSDSATELFVLHAGTRVVVQKQSDTHFRVKYADDKIGWIPLTDIGLI
ncbi:MAG: tetratricopeptide repeat protein [Desulfobacteraceae bacterium]|nr:tetratricopeptide repeat protein [Desulfobacteraceae bacterium]